MNLKLLLLISFSLISGCSLFTKTIPESYPVYYEITCPEPEKPKGIVTEDVLPTAVEDVFGNWWIALTPDSYLNLAKNTDETIRYIKDQKLMIKYYEECVHDFNQKINTLNSEN